MADYVATHLRRIDDSPHRWSRANRTHRLFNGSDKTDGNVRITTCFRVVANGVKILSFSSTNELKGS